MRSRRLPASLSWLATLAGLSIIAAGLAGIVLYRQDRDKTRTQAEALTVGNSDRGKLSVQRVGCGGCHVISGIPGANGQVGPDLTYIAQRTTLAGKLSNEPDNMIEWIMHPQHINPGTGMPEQGIDKSTARDIAAYLYAQ